MWFINEPMLYKAISKYNIGMVNIMIDEYPFVGRCCFAMECENFKKGCGNCPSLNDHPKTLFFDCSRLIYKMKANAYAKIKRSAFIAPEPQIILAKESPMMKDQNLIMLDEAVNLQVYKPSDTSFLRSDLGISNEKIIIMGAAPFSDERKGCKYVLEAAKSLVDDERFVFVHIGYDVSKTDLPKNFIPINYVKDQNTYSQYLSMADLLLFPSYADTLSNTCIAALACGTPLLCFNISGMPYLGNKDVLTIVEPHDIAGIIDVIKHTIRKTDDVITTCRKYAEGRYDSEKYSEKLIAIAENLN